MDKKKLTAVIAAVTAYISTSEEAMAAQAALQASESGTSTESVSAVLPPGATQPANMWGISGRQNQMQANTMMLMRAFK